MHIFQFESRLWLPSQRDEVFRFFSQAFNLEEITPPWLQFQVVTKPPIPMHPGTEIDYRLKIRGIPIRWRSRITVWDPPYRFVDEQIHGPYRLWIHEHRFHESSGGTLCEDLVRYSVYGGCVVNALFVKRDVRNIFDFREARLQAVFRAQAPRSTPSPESKLLKES